MRKVTEANIPQKLFPTVQILLSLIITCQITIRGHAYSPEFFLNEANILRLEN